MTFVGVLAAIAVALSVVSIFALALSAVQFPRRIRTFAGVFSLAAPSVAVGQHVVVTATGLPVGSSFGLQFRIDNESVLVGATASRTGHSRLSFALPSASQGTAHLQVIHDGLTIASLPFDVTLVPRRADAAAPVWPWLLLLVPAAAVIVLFAVRSRRRRRRAAT